MQRIEQQLQRRQPLLAVDDRPLLHLAGLLLHLLQHDGAEEMRVVLVRAAG